MVFFVNSDKKFALSLTVAVKAEMDSGASKCIFNFTARQKTIKAYVWAMLSIRLMNL